jgi:geranylgeranyl diphosphate synthase type II
MAMGYSLLGPGKRIRPLLTMLTSRHCGRRDLAALDTACAIEMVHAASLVMDDLPAMDNARLRRGQPTAHLAHGEDIAILSGIALLNLAYGVLATTAGVTPEVRIALVQLVVGAVGSDGLVGGQVMDLMLRDGSTADHQLVKLNELKTASLLVAAAEAGAIIAGASPAVVAQIRDFALDLGAAFQIADDLLDDPAYARQTGKDTGKDAGKPTLPSRLGREEAKRLLQRHLSSARGHLAKSGTADSPLVSLIDHCFSPLRP